MKKTGRHHIVPVLSKGGNGQSSQHYTIIDVTLFLRPEPRFISAGYPELPVLFLKSSHVALGMIISVKRMNSKISIIFPYFSCSGRSIIQAREKALACLQHHVRLPVAMYGYTVRTRYRYLVDHDLRTRHAPVS